VTEKELNVTDDANLKRFVQEVSELDRIDYLVNAPGIFRSKPLLDSPDCELFETESLGRDSPYLPLRAALGTEMPNANWCA
jgi:NAD(P)-dependent dehydrogenase (short-subunit alcohol dehydrogenase family)